ILAICERSGPTGEAPIFPALWQAMQPPLPEKTASPAFGSPGIFTSAAAPPPDAVAPAVLGMSSSFTSGVPPSDSRNAVSAHSSDRLSAIGGLSTRGLMVREPPAHEATGSINEL